MSEVAAEASTTPRVLLVDDRPDNLLALEAVLAPLPFEFVTAQSGAQALRLLLDHEFALIVLDVQMPDLDGFETARLIKGRERTKHLPILFLTAISGDVGHRLEGYASGAVDYVHKPFHPDILRAKVRVLVDLWFQREVIERQREDLAAHYHRLEEAQAVLARQAAELERSNAALEGFAQQASKSLQEPLHTVAGFLDLLSAHHQSSLSPEGRLLLERAVAGTERLAGLVGSLLTFARASGDELAAEPVELGDVVRSAWQQVEQVEQGEQGAPGAPGAAQLIVGDLPEVVGDRRQLVVLFANLLDNALRYRRAAPPVVRVSAQRDGTEWLVSIADNGPGIPPAVAARLFTVFGHERSPSGAAPVGLAVSRRVAERHGGRLWCEPGPDGGTVVRLTLPFRQS